MPFTREIDDVSNAETEDDGASFAGVLAPGDVPLPVRPGDPPSEVLRLLPLVEDILNHFQRRIAELNVTIDRIFVDLLNEFSLGNHNTK